MDENTIIHIGTELNISSDGVENIENITEVKIQCCCIKVYVKKQSQKQAQFPKPKQSQIQNHMGHHPTHNF